MREYTLQQAGQEPGQVVDIWSSHPYMPLNCSVRAPSSLRFSPMPLTRRPAPSSFTFEIKRANGRGSQAQTVSKTSPVQSALADQVFGAPSAMQGAPSTIPVDQPLPPAPHQAQVAEATLARRVLPDLLTVEVDPVAERMQQLADERLARRKASKASRVGPSKNTAVQHASVNAAPLTAAETALLTETKGNPSPPAVAAHARAPRARLELRKTLPCSEGLLTGAELG